MALKRRFAEKTEALVEPSTHPTADASPRTPTTAPGQMLAFRAELNNASERIEHLEDELGRYRNSLPTFRLNPTQVRASSWANRHPKSFTTDAFRALKEDIRQAGGNVQPIKVRRIVGETESFEVVFGLRRHRACLELELPVLAVIVDLDDQELFAEMDRENRQRADLSPYELGIQYKSALARKLWPSQRQMAEALGVTNGLISQALVLAGLPEPVVAAFESPLDIQYRWGRALADKLQSDPDGVLRRANALNGLVGKSAQEVFATLMDVPAGRVDGRYRDVIVDQAVVARIKSGSSGVTIQFKSSGQPRDENLLRELILQYHSRRRLAAES